MDVGLPRQDQDVPGPIKSPYALWVRDALEVAMNRSVTRSGQAVLWEKRLYDKRVSAACLQWVIGLCVITHRLNNAYWSQPGLDHIWLCRWQDGMLVFSYIRRKSHAPVVWCRGLTLTVRWVCPRLRS